VAGEYSTYTVLPGDNLTKIAQQLSGQTGAALYGYIQALTQINNIADPDKIYIGQTLQYPTEWRAAPVRPVPIPTAPVSPAIAPQPFWKNPVIIGALVIGGIVLLMNMQRR
jgi:LysM repeat protein